MSKFLNISGNYTVAVQDGGIIRLDTGLDTGQVVVTGDLIVQGNTTQVESNIVTIKDNIIILNQGETGSGIFLDESGIEIERGSLADVRLVFDEDVSWTNPISGSGAWHFKEAVSGATIGIQTNQIHTGGANLYLINSGDGVISVTGTSDYEENVFVYTAPGSGIIDITGGPDNNGAQDNDIIPNAKGVADYISSYFASVFYDRIAEGTITPTYVETKDFEITGNPSYVDIGVNDVSVARFYDTRSEINDIRFSNTTISTTGSNADLILVAPGTGAVRVNDTLHINATPSIDDATIDPSSPSDGIKLYSKTPGYGDSGLYFANSNNKTDEVISNNKALIYSMVF